MNIIWDLCINLIIIIWYKIYKWFGIVLKYYDNNIHPIIIIIKKLHSSNINKNKKLHCTENNNNINYFLKIKMKITYPLIIIKNIFLYYITKLFKIFS